MMWPSKIILTICVAVATTIAGAAPKATSTPSPLGDLQRQIDQLTSRIAALENAPENSIVDGRSYCMMVNVTILRGPAGQEPGTIETLAVRRHLLFSGGSLTATLVESNRNVKEDTGPVAFATGMSPEVLQGTYSQSGSELNILLDDTPSPVRWYVSGDGTVIHNNGIDFLGPFPNSLTIGIVRSATMIESDSCAFDG